MVTAQAEIEPVFRALSHPTRRAVVETLSHGPAPVSALAGPSGMALPSFLEHLRALEACGLVRSEKVGRVRVCWLDLEPLERAEGWLTKQRTLWERRLDQLDDYLITLKQQEAADE